MRAATLLLAGVVALNLASAAAKEDPELQVCLSHARARSLSHSLCFSLSLSLSLYLSLSLILYVSISLVSLSLSLSVRVCIFVCASRRYTQNVVLLICVAVRMFNQACAHAFTSM